MVEHQTPPSKLSPCGRHIWRTTDLKASVLGLQFWVKEDNFDLGKLKVKCQGHIPSVYFMESDSLIVGQHTAPEHKVLQATSSTKGKQTADCNQTVLHST